MATKHYAVRISITECSPEGKRCGVDLGLQSVTVPMPELVDQLGKEEATRHLLMAAMNAVTSAHEKQFILIDRLIVAHLSGDDEDGSR